MGHPAHAGPRLGCFPAGVSLLSLLLLACSITLVVAMVVGVLGPLGVLRRDR